MIRKIRNYGGSGGAYDFENHCVCTAGITTEHDTQEEQEKSDG